VAFAAAAIMVYQRVERSRGERQRDVNWHISGRVKSLFKFDGPLDFGEQSEESQPFTSLRVGFTPHIKLSLISVRCDASLFFHPNIQPVAGQPSRYDLVIKPVGRLPRGDVKLNLELLPISAAGDALSAVTYPVRGKVVPDIHSMPPVVHFGACPIGDEPAATATLGSLMGNPFGVDRVETSDSSLIVTVSGYGANIFDIRQRVKFSGSQSGWVTFHIRKRDGQREKVIVPVRAHGIVRKQEVSP
jgi:hypothetical protein